MGRSLRFARQSKFPRTPGSPVPEKHSSQEHRKPKVFLRCAPCKKCLQQALPEEANSWPTLPGITVDHIEQQSVSSYSSRAAAGPLGFTQGRYFTFCR
eukprot:9467400-Pyramimonas_sp.AAC.1